MSLTETQQIYELLQRIDELLSGIETKTQNIEIKESHMAETVITATQLLRVLWRITSVLEKMGLPKQGAAAIGVLQGIAHAAVMANMALNMLYLGTPYGIIMGVTGLATTVIGMGAIASPLEGY